MDTAGHCSLQDCSARVGDRPVLEEQNRSPALKPAGCDRQCPMDEIEVYIPTGDTRNIQFALAPRLDCLAKKKIAWLDNQKANAALLMVNAAKLLGAHAPDSNHHFYSKNATKPAPDAVMAYLQTCDAVVLAIAD